MRANVRPSFFLSVRTTDFHQPVWSLCQYYSVVLLPVVAAALVVVVVVVGVNAHFRRVFENFIFFCWFGVENMILIETLAACRAGSCRFGSWLQCRLLLGEGRRRLSGLGAGRGRG